MNPMSKIISFALTDWELGDTHGLPHWQRVERNGILLSLDKHKGRYIINKGIRLNVVRAFAYLHDKCRIDNYSDWKHGERAARMLHNIRDSILFELDDEEFSLLETACRLHTTTHKTGNLTIDTCFDADRLDLNRVGIIPEPNRMATEKGAYYARDPEAFNEFIKMYESYIKFT